MNTITISEVSQQFNISTRMLRYYEKEGLISSIRLPDYAYRVYDMDAIKRLQQILVLRKLRIPVKQIAQILDDDDKLQTLEILQKNLEEMNEEIAALEKIRDILAMLASKLNESTRSRLRLDLLEDAELMDIIHVLKPSKTQLKEGFAVNELVEASKVLESKIDVRIIYLPPAVVASCQYTGENPEDIAKERIYSFIRESNLPVLKPDFRIYGFNNPSPAEGRQYYGYEFWVTIPEDMEVKPGIVKKKFAGGLYAAHCIKFGDFHEWETFIHVMKNNEEYEIDWREPEGMGGCLEEELNVYSNMLEKAKKAEQLDLLIPIRKKLSADSVRERKKTMELVMQPTFSTCGQACIAMITGKDIQEVIKDMKTDGPTSIGQLIEALDAYGIRHAQKNVRISQKNPVPADFSILTVHMKAGYTHWVLYYHGKYYDPEFGLSDACHPEGRVTSFLAIEE